MINNKIKSITFELIILIAGIIPIILIPLILFIYGYWTIALLIILIYYIFNFLALLDSYANNRSDIQVKITWTVLFFTLPGVSAYIFFLFVKIPKKIKIFFKEVKSLENDILNKNINNSKIEFLENGAEKFPSLFYELSKAKNYINIQYFIIHPGIVQQKLFSILKDRIENGVKVRILVDYFGGLFWEEKDIEKLKNEGFDIVEFKPIKWYKPSGSDNWRSHNKSVTIDGNVAFFGGINIGDEYLGLRGKYGDWIDLHYKCHGDIVKSLDSIFFIQWFITTKKNISHEYKKYYNNSSYNYVENKKEEYKLELIYDSPNDDFAKTFERIKKEINNSKTSIKIITPYVAFPVSFKDTIRNALNRNVKIEIITIGRIDKKTAYYQGTFDVDTLIQLGVDVYRAKNLFIHSKMFIFDEKNVIFGTSNLDYRAFFYHFETNLIMTDHDINWFEKYFQKTKEISLLQTYSREDWWIGRQMMYFIMRFLKAFF